MTTEMEALQRAIKNQNKTLALHILEENKKDEKEKYSFKSDLEHYYCKKEDSNENTDDNILHHAVTHLDEKHRQVIEELVQQCPELLEKAKTNNDHGGQTPLHILIVRKHNDTLKEIKRLLLDATIGDNILHNIFNPKVEGILFRKTSMEGELPYIVAVLTLDIETAKVVLEMTDDQAKKISSYHKYIYPFQRGTFDILVTNTMFRTTLSFNSNLIICYKTINFSIYMFDTDSETTCSYKMV